MVWESDGRHVIKNPQENTHSWGPNNQTFGRFHPSFRGIHHEHFMCARFSPRDATPNHQKSDTDAIIEKCIQKATEYLQKKRDCEMIGR